MNTCKKGFSALISAAGLSSRMGDWKAVMEIEGVPNILRELRTCFLAGVDRVVIVTGWRGEELENRLEQWLPREEWERVRFVPNPRYAETSMFDSVRIGLEALREEALSPTGDGGGRSFPEGILFFPVDVPLFSVFTCRRLMETACQLTEEEGREGEWALLPAFQGRRGHPVLFSAAVVPRILEHDGEGGLKGVLGKFPCREVPVPDPAILLDADTPEEFARLLREAEERRRPGTDRCLLLLRYFGVQEKGIAHALAVAEAAEEILRKSPAAGTDQEEEILAACRLHDIAKGQPHHADTGAGWLEELGYEGVASLVRTHMEIPEEDLKPGNPNAIVFLADKLTAGDRRVSLEERFAPGRERFRDNPEAWAAWERRFALAKRALELFGGGKGGDKWQQER